VRAILTDDVLTPDFWLCVDQRTLQLTSMLLPMIHMMDEHFPASRDKSFRKFFQDIHAIVATAGYLALGIRWSRDIFRFSLPFPSEVWNHDQQHVDDGVYKASVAANDKADGVAKAKWMAGRNGRQQEQEADRHNPPTIAARGVGIATSVTNRLDAVRRRALGHGAGGHESQAENTSWVQPARIAKVQIILWPCLKRYARVGEVDPGTGSAEGEAITSLLKSQVVYYCGRERELEGEGERYPGLDDWMDKSRRVRRHNSRRPFRWVAYAIGIWLLLRFLGQYSSIANGLHQAVTNGLVKVATLVGRTAALCVMEVAITPLTIAFGVAKLALFPVYLARNSVARLIEICLRLIWGVFGGATGEGSCIDAAGVCLNSASGYPDLSWGPNRELARALAGVVWKTLTVWITIWHWASGQT